jgi:hypothetical protein
MWVLILGSTFRRFLCHFQSESTLFILDFKMVVDALGSESSNLGWQYYTYGSQLAIFLVN